MLESQTACPRVVCEFSDALRENVHQNHPKVPNGASEKQEADLVVLVEVHVRAMFSTVEERPPPRHSQLAVAHA